MAGSSNRMEANIYIFTVRPDIPFDEAMSTLRIATGAAEALVGATALQLDASQRVEASERRITVGGAPYVRDAIAKVFLSFVRRQFGDDAIVVSRQSRARSHPEPSRC